MRTKPALASAVIAITVGLSAAQAQNAVSQFPLPAPAQVAGPVTGVRAITPPPEGFDPVAASPMARTQYHVPPEPNAATNPHAHEQWEKAMTGFRHLNRNTPTPTLTATKLFHGPAKLVGPVSKTENGTISVNFLNWSGTAVTDDKKPFAHGAIVAEFVVPTARQPFGTCSGDWTFSSQWVGLDGYSNSDVLQAGTEADAFCASNGTAQFYAAWFEWFPIGEVRVSAPTINPGDLILVQVWNESPTDGFAFFYNFSTVEAAEYEFTAPAGTSLIGNSAEWIVERPSDSAGLTSLTSYTDIPFSYGAAWSTAVANPPQYLMGAANPPTGTLAAITMLDDNNKPISAATIENSDFLYFQNFGSSCGVIGGNPPC
jgi:peptidase A4-like protein